MLLNKVLFFKILLLPQKNYVNLPLVVVLVSVIRPSVNYKYFEPLRSGENSCALVATPDALYT